jgi:hypothetical protein
LPIAAKLRPLLAKTTIMIVKSKKPTPLAISTSISVIAL